MNMKFQIVNLLILVWMFTSCSVYQYATVESDLPKNERSEFVMENDSMILKFSFSGENMPVNIEVFNKLNAPLYVDWRRSSVVIGDKSQLLKQDVTHVNLNTQSVTVNDQAYHPFVYSYGEISGNFIKEGLESFIPPKASIFVTPCHLRSEFLDVPVNAVAERVTVPGINSPVDLKRYQFDRAHTPLAFRLFLTMSYAQDFKDPLFFDQLFYVNDLARSHSSENQLVMRPANRAYFSKTTGFGVFLGGVAVTSLVIIGLAASTTQAP